MITILSTRFLIDATSLKQLLYLRAIQHFGNSQSLVALPINNYSLNNKDFFLPDSEFGKLKIKNKTSGDFKLKAIQLYQNIANFELFSDDQKMRFHFKRLEYIRSNSDIYEKDLLYVDALKKIIDNENNGDSKQLAYIKLAEHYFQLAEVNGRNKLDNNVDAYKEVYRWIEKGKQAFPNGIYNDIVDRQKLKLNQKYLTVQTEQVVIPNKDFLANIKYRNSSKAFFKLISLSSDQLKEYNLIRRKNDKLDYLLSQSIFRNWMVELPQADDFNYHNIEIPIDGLNFGSYFLISSTNSDFKFDELNIDLVNQFHVSNLSYVHQNREGVFEGYVLNRQKGEPVQNANIDVFISKYMPNKRQSEWQKVETLKSDANGFFSLTNGQSNFSIKVSNGEDVLDLRNSHYNYRKGNERFYNTVNLFTDRAIYRPGQIVYFKGIVLNQSSTSRIPKIVADQKVTIKLKDANWQDVSDLTLTSNEYGTFNGKFVTPSSGLLGRFTISVEVDNGNGQKQISVEEYKRPKFYIDFEKLSDTKTLGDTIEISGSAIAFSGVKMSNADVKYYVLKKQNYYPYFYKRVGFDSQRTEEIISRGVVRTDSVGSFKINFDTKKSFKPDQSYIYEIRVDVTDITGMSTNESKQIVVSQVPFNFKSNLTTNVFESDLDDINSEVTNNEGELISAKIKVSITSLESPQTAKKVKYWNKPDVAFLNPKEFESRFPNESNGINEDPSKWKELKSIRTETIETLESSSISLKKLKRGSYKVQFDVTDTNGNSKIFNEFLNITSKKEIAIPTDYIWHSKLKPKYQPGEKLKINFNFPFEEFNVYYRINQGDKVVLTDNLSKRNRSIEYTIQESDRGNLNLEIMYIMHNRIYSKRLNINVPWDNKKLKINIESFRDKLEPGSEESWTIKLEDYKGNNVSSEVLAAMYDSSLDQLISHNWKTTIFPNYFTQMKYNGVAFSASSGMIYKKYNNSSYQTYLSGFSPYLNWFNFSLPYSRNGRGAREEGRIMKRSSAPMAQQSMEMNDAGDQVNDIESLGENETIERDLISSENSNDSSIEKSIHNPIKIRENLNETVFFYPKLMTSSDGEANLTFKMNEALTKWKLLIFAHTKDLEYSYNEFTVETAKDLLIEPNLPRFLRQGDNITLNAKVSNLSEKPLDVKSEINLLGHSNKLDITNQMLTNGNSIQSLLLQPAESKIVSWSVKVSKDFIDLLDVKMTVYSESISDGELNQLPVLSNRMLVTESMVMHIDALENEVFKFEAMHKMDHSKTLENFKYTLEFYTNPSWLVLKSLPAMMDRESIVTTNIFDSYYATSIGSDLVRKDNRIKEMIKSWVANDETGNLSKNTDLKISDLDETPWVTEANSEYENIRMLSTFLDDNMIIQDLHNLTNKIKGRQLSNGGFSWTPGGKDNWYITQYILEGLSRLNALGVDISTFDASMLNEAVFYIDQEMLQLHKRRGQNNKILDAIVVHFLFVRPQFDNVPISRHLRKVMDHYQNLILENWTKRGSYEQGLMAYGLHLDNKDELALDIVKSLKERLIKDEKLGYYWNDQAGYYWYNANVEKQAFMIDLFKKFNEDQTIIDGLKLWLLKNKQTNSWKTNKATASAVFAFMNDSKNWIENNEEIKIDFPIYNSEVSIDRSESNSLLLKQVFQGDDIDASLSDVQIENSNNHVAWGASYWQYFEDLDKIEAFSDTPLKIDKKLFKVVQSDNGDKMISLKDEVVLKPGDKLRVRINLSVDRPMEFVQMKDLRGSGLEPLNVLSQYKWQDGLGYYESTKDLATYFYFDYLPKGNFVFEYDMYVVHEGVFSNGNCSIQSMYAPEFGSHSQGETLRVE